MTAFQEFLREKARTDPQRLALRSEWLAAVDRLMDQLFAWLKEADPEGVLLVSRQVSSLYEPRLGSYRTTGLQIGVGDAIVQVEPVGRNVIGVIDLEKGTQLRAEGRVDVTNGSRRYILYRVVKDGQEIWYALDERFRASVLDRARLEEILQDLMS